MVERYSQVLMTDIIVFFQDGYAPHWTIMEDMFKRHKLTRSREMDLEFLPADFIKELFESAPEISRRIEAMGFRHHQILIMLIKHTYGMMTCSDCGCLWRNPFNSKRIPPRSFFYAGKNTFCRTKRRKSRSRSKSQNRNGLGKSNKIRWHLVDSITFIVLIDTLDQDFENDIIVADGEDESADVVADEFIDIQSIGQDETGCKGKIW